eukprot:COSAG06_NODE_1408_length_9549_cov_12.628677_8_plen_73_part_00
MVLTQRRFVSFRFVSFRFVSFRFVVLCFVSFRFVVLCFVSFAMAGSFRLQREGSTPTSPTSLPCGGGKKWLV